MKKISPDQLGFIKKYLEKNCRKLEFFRLRKILGESVAVSVVEELARFQNEDGGFGKGLEPDFVLPASSPMATTVAFQIMDEIRWESCYELYEKGIAYFESCYRKEHKRWFAVPPEVNDFPHAPWWNVDPDSGESVIDKFWGNPTAEILAFLIRHYEFVKEIDLSEILDRAMKNFLDKKEFKSGHEIFCYLRLFGFLDIVGKQNLYPVLEDAINQIMVTDIRQWGDYVPRPLDFVDSPDSEFIHLVKPHLEANLDYLVDTFDDKELWSPHWEWGQFPEEWAAARENWRGVLAVKNVKILKNFGRIQG